MIAYQANILDQLKAGGIEESPRRLASRLNLLATIGGRLRQRYENTCSYAWANGPEYEHATEKLEKRAKAIAAEAGLQIYLQTDCRGAAVYVDAKPIPENAYNRAHCLTIETADERRRRLAAARKGD